MAVNCAAIVETLLEAELFGIEDRTATGVRGRRGKFEHAHEGTLFLDEVSDLSAAAQAKLLRAIQDLSVERVGGVGARRVDTRIIVASNRSLLDLVEQKRFRLDLFYRLNGVEVQVPPLRCRRDDILELARYFLERHRAFRPLALSTAAADALLTYDWPGNVRELERVVERGVALAGGSMLELDDLPPALLGGYADVLVPALQARVDDAGVGQPVCAAGARAVREQQAEDLPGAPDFLPHAGGVPALRQAKAHAPAGAACRGRAGRSERLMRGERTFPGSRTDDAT